eukprot:191149-Alexandrium_andersonii.AAC.1
MSASLVGSEMCIRDRLPFDAAAIGWTLSHSVQECVHANAQLHCVPLPLLCLLYTSDAADDM